MELTLAQQVGAKLKALREKKELNVVDAAKGVGVGFRSLYDWESGTRSPSTRNLEKLAAFYGTTAAKLLK